MEIKGYKDKKVEAKLNSVTDRQITILYKNDLKFAFDWVYNNYSFSELEDLYDTRKKKKRYTKPALIVVRHRSSSPENKHRAKPTTKIAPVRIQKQCLWCGATIDRVARTEY